MSMSAGPRDPPRFFTDRDRSSPRSTYSVQLLRRRVFDGRSDQVVAVVVERGFRVLAVRRGSVIASKPRRATRPDA